MKASDYIGRKTKKCHGCGTGMQWGCTPNFTMATVTLCHECNPVAKKKKLGEYAACGHPVINGKPICESGKKS